MQVAGSPVLVARTSAGDVIAVGPICPHQGRPMDGGNAYGERSTARVTTTPTDAHTGDNHYPKRVFPRARGEQVKPIRTFPAREERGWVWVQVNQP